jgi:hypothetical protein
MKFDSNHGAHMAPRLSRSGSLLKNVLDTGDLTANDIAQELSISVADVEQLVSGGQVMSLAHQLCFATLLVERVPRLARDGHALRGQVAAAMAFEAGETRVHNSAPAKWSSLKRG